MLGKRFIKGKQKIFAFMMAVIMVINGIGIIPINAEAAGRKIVTKLSVKQTSLKLEEGESQKIKYKVTATKGTSKKIVVKVSNKKVVSAKVSGGKIVVNAKKEGKSVITVMTKAKNKNSKRIAKKIHVVVENDDDELKYDFEDDETYEEDETTEDADVVTELPTTTESVADELVTTEAMEKITESTMEKIVNKPITAEALSTTKKAEALPSISYQVHIQDIGWMSNVKDGATAGTTGQAKRLEGLKINLKDDKGNSMLKYRAHAEGTGWQDWKTSGQAAGTENKSKRMEGIQIQLTGTYAEKYDIYYCVHVANFGWLGWAKNGETAGSEGLALQMEAIQIKLVKKNEAFSVGGRHVIVRPNLTYQVHCAYSGWQSAVINGRTAGTVGEKRQLEGLKINLADTDGKSGVEYRAHVADVGWQGWKDSGVLAGTTGESRKMEAIEIKLKGNLVKDYDIYYRAHVADIGWLGWAKNGETAGTTGGARQMEAIEIQLVGKGASINRGGAAYIDLSNKTREIKLVHHMNGSLKQFDQGCCAMSYAIGLSIVNRRAYNPATYWYGGTTHYDSGRVGSYVNFNAATVYNALKNGKPTMIHYKYAGNSGQHWVLIMGVRSGADSNNLLYGDFYAIDPATGRQITLTSSYRWGGCKVSGMRVFY